MATTAQLSSALLMVDGRATDGGTVELPPNSRLLLDVNVEGSEPGDLLADIATARDEAQAAAALATDLSGISTPDGVIANRITTDGTATEAALSAKIATQVPINPLSYGAAGNGATNDTAAIQAAVNACAVGGVVDGRGKTYVVDSIVLKSDMEFRNFNLITRAGAVDLRSPVTIGAYNDTTTRRNIILRNVHVDGARVGQTSIGATEDGGRHGFRLIGAIENLLMEDCSATMCASDGLCIYGGSGMDAIRSFSTGIKKNIRVVRCDFTFNRRHGVSLDSATEVLFEDCTLNDNGLTVAGGTAGAAAALLGGQPYGNGIDIEEYTLKTYVGNVKMVRCQGVRNAKQGVLLYQPSSSLASDANWFTRSGFDFINCHFDKGATGNVAIEATPIYANRNTGWYFTDIRIVDCRLDGIAVLRSVKSASHRGGSVVGDGTYVGLADKVEKLKMAHVDTANGTRWSNSTDTPVGAVTYADVTDELWIGAATFSRVSGTATLGAVVKVPAWIVPDNESAILTALANVPAGWAAADVYAVWANGSAAAGDIYIRVDIGAVVAGSAAPDPANGSIVYGTAGAQNVVVSTKVESNKAITAGLNAFEYLRVGTVPGDTLAGPSALIGLRLVRR